MTDAVVTLRTFNRFHTRISGALAPRYMGSEMTLPEARLLYEIVHRAPVVARTLQTVLGLDAGYASRMLRRFEERGWIERGRGEDARHRPISPTKRGRDAFAALDQVTRADVEGLMAPLGEAQRAALADALDRSRALLGDPELALPTYRTFRAGDMGLITARQAILYAESHGWGVSMEALVGEVTAAFVRNFKPGREQCWIAERGEAMAGSVFCCDSGERGAQLRLLYVEPEARGLGIGGELIRRCVTFARDAGYPAIWLWTHSVLTPARRLYAEAGFEIVSTEVHHAFGRPEQGETWELRF